MQIALLSISILIFIAILTTLIGFIVVKIKNKQQNNETVKVELDNFVKNFKENFENEYKLIINKELTNLIEANNKKTNETKEQISIEYHKNFSDFNKSIEEIKTSLASDGENSLKSQLIQKINHIKTELSGDDSFSLKSNLINKIESLKTDTTNNLTKIENNLTGDTDNTLKSTLNKNLKNELEQFQKLINNQIELMKKTQETNLSEIRNDINEKLHSELVKKIEDEFKTTVETIDKINKSVGLLNNMQNNITRLTNIFENNKEYGNLGETLLETLVGNWYGYNDELYKTQYKIDKQGIVDLAFFIRDKENKEVILPIDSKFPVATYEEYLNAKSDIEKSEANKKLMDSFKERIKETAKYVMPNKTTEKAIMYIPSESMYYFFISNSDFRKIIENNAKKVIIAGPLSLINYIDASLQYLKNYSIIKNLDTIKEAFTAFVSSFKQVWFSLKISKDAQSKSLEEITNLNKHLSTSLIKVFEAAQKTDVLKLENEKWNDSIKRDFKEDLQNNFDSDVKSIDKKVINKMLKIN
ncbi:DNA recombination protein RmuC [Mycoplasmopsis gallinarum]|uniref:DNA recombination protein RmuC n=1 Tax=Mycoplasmopsis gallinarum TaxID=29557 RepID=UPI0007C466AE|nr:DNA recombination protein RmuC [Mycoplasmopsis gallinarum]